MLKIAQTAIDTTIEDKKQTKLFSHYSQSSLWPMRIVSFMEHIVLDNSKFPGTMHRVPICDFVLFLESQVAHLAGAVQSLLERAIKWTLTTIYRLQYRKTFSSSIFLNILTEKKTKIGLTLLKQFKAWVRNVK